MIDIFHDLISQNIVSVQFLARVSLFLNGSMTLSESNISEKESEFFRALGRVEEGYQYLICNYEDLVLFRTRTTT